MRVERLLNIIAMVLPAKLLSKCVGMAPDLREVLCEEAFRTRVVSSLGVRSAIERKWRGAKGEVWGVEGVE